MDKLEEYIRKNREDMDRYRPSSGVWKGIKSSLKKRKSPLSHWLSIAAMVIVVLGSAIVLLGPANMWRGRNNGMEINSGMMPAKSQLKETEVYYNNLINSLYHEATPLLTGNPEIEKELNNDISHLDSICSEIKKDLKDNVANQEVVEALIQNYRIKIRILEDMLSVLKKDSNNPEKNETNEL